MTRTLAHTMHVHIFGELIKGRFQPSQAKFSNPEELKNLVAEAQTNTVTVLPAGKDPDEYIAETDFLAFGFKEEADFDVIQKDLGSGRTAIIVVPTRIYEGCEVLDIPAYTSFKVNIFLELIMDEFERVKIRAEKKLENTDDRRVLAVYAEKHIAKLKKLFYDAKVLLNGNHHRDDIYILLSLSMVLIRTILFYQKMFKQFLATPPDNQEQLKSELFSSIALGRLKVLFDMRGSQYCSFIKKSYLQEQDTEDCCLDEPRANKAETFSEKKSLHQDKDIQAFHPAKWHGQLNVLADIFIRRAG